tara:strand:- start:216 stop:587 length:372 start_codon:yes stop_codon:yes gene_type:complete
MKNIVEAADIPLNEKVYLKKDGFGWKVVEPVKDPETGEIIWSNFFSKRMLFVSGIYAIIALLLWVGINDLTSSYKDAAENPCDYCSLNNNIDLNSSHINNLKLIPDFDISEALNATDTGGEND